MSICEKLFYCYCIKANAYRYHYGRQANKTLRDIALPDTIPDWVYTINANVPITNNSAEIQNVDCSSWKWFTIGGEEGIFEIEGCKCKNAGELLGSGSEIEYIGAKKNDNGVMAIVKREESLVTKGNCIIFICDGQGSVGFTNYIDHDFIGSTTLSVGRNKNLNKYNALFLVAVLDRERYRYSFGRKYKSNLTKARIKLPEKNGKPDWEYMEKYIKSQPFGDLI